MSDTNNPRNWWQNTQALIERGKVKFGKMQGIANDLFNGDVNVLPGEINLLFHSVTAHLNMMDNIAPHTEDIAPHAYIIKQ